MKRKMIGAAAAYLAGLFFASFFTRILFAAALVLILVLLFAGGVRGKDILLLLVFFTGAFGISKAYSHFHYDRIVSCSGSNGDFSGRIVGIESYSGDLALYTLEGELNGIRNVRVTHLGSGLNAEYGDILHLSGCKFSEFSNDYVFKSRDINMAERIFLSADYPESTVVERTHSMKLKNALMNYREDMLSRFRSSMGGTTGDFLGAMVFGEKSGIEADTKTALYRTGIGHVMAVSGIHVSVIAVMLMAVLSRLRLGRFIPFLLMNVLLILFITMAEWPFSAVRALIMADFYYSARLFRRQSDTFNSLAGAVLVICIANPLAIYSSGFLMSVTAAFGIGVFGPYMTRDFTGNKHIRSILTMVCTSVCIFPLTVKYFSETSLVSPLTNLLLLPLCTAALIVGAVFVMTGGFLPVLGIAELLLRPVLAVSDMISANRIAYFACSGESTADIIFVLAAVVIVLHVIYNRRAVTAVAMAVSFCAVMVYSAFAWNFTQDSLRVAFLGRGKNMAAVVSYKGTVRIFDLSGYHGTPAYVRKYLTENGISEIDSIALAGSGPSQYASYISELAPVNVGEWYSADELYTGDADTAEISEEIHFSTDGLEVIYRENSLFIDFCGTVISVGTDEKGRIFTVGGDALTHDITIDKEENNGLNNFEIKLSDGDGYELRRL